MWTAARSLLQRAEGKEDISSTYLGADGRYFARVTAQQGDTVRDGHSYITPFLIWVEYTIFSGGGEWFFWRGLV